MITGDANLSEISTYLKLGTASWVLRVIEAGELGRRRPAGRHQWPRCGRSATTWPVRELLYLRGRAQTMTRAGPPGGLPRRLPQPLRADCRRSHRDGPDRGQGHLHPLAGLSWTALRNDIFQPRRPARLGRQAQADGVLPAARRTELDRAPKLALIDLQYADVDPRRSLYRRAAEPTGRCGGSSPMTRSSAPAPPHRRTPAPTSAAG